MLLCKAIVRHQPVHLDRLMLDVYVSFEYCLTSVCFQRELYGVDESVTTVKFA